MRKGENQVIIIGGGLCGALLALRLGQRGLNVQVFEKRGDMRKELVKGGRSINMSLSPRGFQALELVGLKEKVMGLITKMEGRIVHPLKGEQVFMKYSGREGETIDSICREALNRLLLDEAEKLQNVEFFFNSSCEKIDMKEGKVQIRQKKRVNINQKNIHELILDQDGETLFWQKAAFIFGADGAYSAVRKCIQDQSASLRFNYQQEYLNLGYKELTIPRQETDDDKENQQQNKKMKKEVNKECKMDRNAFHLWPRGEFMMIAQPNVDGSFTATLFMPYSGSKNSFEALKNEDQIIQFFKDNFTFDLDAMPSIIEDFKKNKVSSLHTIKCYPWAFKGKVLLIGDSAHALVPFYGQGMNCAFEDVVVLDKILDSQTSSIDWNQVSLEYQESRKIHTDSIADLAVENHHELSVSAADPIFQIKRKIEILLESNIPGYFSKYSLVVFRPDISYEKAKILGRKQDEILMKFAKTNPDLNNLNLLELFQKIQSEIQDI